MDTLATARLAAHDRAEEDILLHRGCRVVALGVEELDRTPQLLRQPRGEGAPRLQYPLLHLFVDQIERVAGRDQFERQRQKTLSRGLQQLLDPGSFHPLENALEDRQIVGADERELLEQHVFGVQTC